MFARPIHLGGGNSSLNRLPLDRYATRIKAASPLCCKRKFPEDAPDMHPFVNIVDKDSIP